MRLTAIIVDEDNEKRSVSLSLSEEQGEALRLKHGESYLDVFFEKEREAAATECYPQPLGKSETKEAPLFENEEDEYLFHHNRSGIRPGHQVLILRSCDHFEGGWDSSWVNEMNDAVKKVGVVTEDYGNAGFEVEFYSGGGFTKKFNFPYFVLEKIEK